MFRHQEEEQAADPAPAGPTTEELLAEIRDLLKEKGTNQA
jgi:large conductance mechanosensitive channel